MNNRIQQFLDTLRLWVYEYSLVPAFFLSILSSILIIEHLGTIILTANASTLATAGITIAAFLYTVQGLLIAIPESNRFMLQLRRYKSRYLKYLHLFCHRAELFFMFVFFPMLFSENILNHFIPSHQAIISIVFLSFFFSGFLFSLWAMWLLGSILLRCEEFR